MTGLVCDIGELVLAATLPEQLQAAWQHAAERSLPRTDAERKVLGATHAEVGACLLGLWGLPFTIVEAVAAHHPSESGDRQGSELSTIVWVASGVASDDSAEQARVARDVGGPQLLERAVALRAAALGLNTN
jgi:HD-like signal output (HDOD) protein